MLRLLTIICGALLFQSEENGVLGWLLFVFAAKNENLYAGTSPSFTSSAVQLDVKPCITAQALHTIEIESNWSAEN